MTEMKAPFFHLFQDEKLNIFALISYISSFYHGIIYVVSETYFMPKACKKKSSEFDFTCQKRVFVWKTKQRKTRLALADGTQIC